MRPPGYEPGELPTAPLRDDFLFAGAKVQLIFQISKYCYDFFAILRFFVHFTKKVLAFSNKKSTFAHCTLVVQNQ